MNRAFSKILILAILIILVGGGIFAWQYFKISEDVELPKKVIPEEGVIKDETAEWQTYRNEEYGFTIKYPQNLSLKEEKGYIEFADWESSENIQISIRIATTDLSINDYLKKYGTEEKAESVLSRKCDSICLYTSINGVKDIYIDNTLAVQMYAWLSAVGGTVTLVKESPKILIEIINFCLPEKEILEGWTTDKAILECFEQQKTGVKRSSDIIYDQMLSTFRFINK